MFARHQSLSTCIFKASFFSTEGYYLSNERSLDWPGSAPYRLSITSAACCSYGCYCYLNYQPFQNPQTSRTVESAHRTPETRISNPPPESTKYELEAHKYHTYRHKLPR